MDEDVLFWGWVVARGLRGPSRRIGFAVLMIPSTTCRVAGIDLLILESNGDCLW